MNVNGEFRVDGDEGFGDGVCTTSIAVTCLSQHFANKGKLQFMVVVVVVV